jgi:addiction module HigA family antidote
MTEHRISSEVRQEERVYAPVHPGEIIEQEWLEPLGMTSYQLAKAMGVRPPRAYEVVSGKRAITADTALRLERVLGFSAQFWMRLQAQYDLEMIEWHGGAHIDEQAKPLIRDQAG